jgi:hypothetical protein
MKRTVLVAAAVCSLGFLAVPAMAQGQGGNGPLDFPTFSADTSMVVGGHTMTATIARSGNKLRSGLPNSTGQGYVLMLLDQHKAYMVMGAGTCVEMPAMAQVNSNIFASAGQGSVQVTQVGTGTANGHPVKIEDVTVTPSKGGDPVHMKIWAATDLHNFPARLEVQTPHGTVTTDYTNISLSTPPDSLFAVPTNCHQMPTMPGAAQP